MKDIITLLSIVINVVLIIIGVGLAVSNYYERQSKKLQVKIWMEQANGVSQALLKIIQDKWAGLYSSINDITNAINAVQSSSFSLYQSLYEERTLSEKEYKEQEMERRADFNKKLKQQEKIQQSSVKDK